MDKCTGYSSGCTCSSCNTGYKPNWNGTACEGCGLAQCTGYSSGCTCSSCNAGYAPNWNGSACAACTTANCASYSSGCWCGTCNTGYTTNGSGGCKDCGVANCTAYSSGCTCKNCATGYTTNGSGGCKSACASIANCLEYDSSCNCSKCADGFEFRDASWDDICCPIKPACSDCDSWCKNNGHPSGEMAYYCASDNRYYCSCQGGGGWNCRVDGSTACSKPECKNIKTYCQNMGWKYKDDCNNDTHKATCTTKNGSGYNLLLTCTGSCSSSTSGSTGGASGPTWVACTASNCKYQCRTWVMVTAPSQSNGWTPSYNWSYSQQGWVNTDHGRYQWHYYFEGNSCWYSIDDGQGTGSGMCGECQG